MADTKEQELDEDGLVVQKYESVVLCVLPQEGFGDQILRYARSALYNVHVGTWSVSMAPDEPVTGRLQDEFLVDAGVASADMSRYSGILIAGSEGKSSLAEDAKTLQLVRDAAAEGKLIAAWGNALEVLINAGVVKGKKVTGDRSLADAARKGGGKFTGRQVEIAGSIVTASDEGAGMRFGQALAELVRI